MNHQHKPPKAITVVGPGRVGRALADAVAEAGFEVDLVGRGFDPAALAGREVLLCVPDAAIPGVTDQIAGSGQLPRLLGHTSGATTLEPLGGCQTEGAFSLHPLQTLTGGGPDALKGCSGAIAASSPAGRDFVMTLARAVGISPFEVAEQDRASYHAAASIAANYLITLEQAAAGLLEAIGVDSPREKLSPLIRRSLANWEAAGATALTGPIARGDEGTVRLHRSALRERQPELLDLYDVMAEHTRVMAAAEAGR